MNKLHITGTATLLAALLATSTAQAYQERETYGTVVRSEPVVRIVNVSVPREECWQEPVQHRAERDYTTGRTILGGLIGAAIGHQIGHGHHRSTATVAGGLAGAAIGANSAKRDRYAESYVTEETRCRTVYETHREERIEAYAVTYRYGGETYHTELPYEPGRRIPINVSVSPANYAADY